MGALPDTYTAYRSVGDEDGRALVRGGVGRPALAREGLHDPADVRRRRRRRPQGDVHLRRGRRADRPEHRARRQPRSRSLEFLVCQDIFETETTKYADVDPAGVVVPGEDRHVHERRAAHPARRRRRSTRPAAARTDFDIITTVSRALGHEMGYDDPADVMDEIAALTPHFAGVTFERLGRSGLQWPVAPDGTDTPISTRTSFRPPGGRAQLRRAAVQGARRRRRRRVPADPRHRPASCSTTTPAR